MAVAWMKPLLAAGLTRLPSFINRVLRWCWSPRAPVLAAGRWFAGGWRTPPPTQYHHELQAAAGGGQNGLTQCYEQHFARRDRLAQIIVTHDDLSNRKRYLNALSALRTLVEMRVVPVINENDTVVTDEIRFGDNDTLGALVANLLEDGRVTAADRPGRPVRCRPTP